MRGGGDPDKQWIAIEERRTASRAAAVRRASELGDAWHPSRRTDADHVRRVKEQHPELRVIPRTSPDKVEAMLQAGAEGGVISFADEAAMRDFKQRYT